MASDLEDLRERIKWCRDQTMVLAAEIDGYCRFTGIKMTAEIDPKTGEGSYFVEQIKPIPRSFSIQGGVIAHELRATLDSLACVLATRNGNEPKNVYFCIARDETAFETDGLNHKLKKLSDSDRKILASLQPWEAGNPMLFALHAADLVRKHQRLILTQANLGKSEVYSIDGADILLPEGSSKASVARYLLARSAPGTHIGVRMQIGVSFGEPKILVGRPIQSVLRDFAGLTESIIELFD
jgi:hypothetical protein